MIERDRRLEELGEKIRISTEQAYDFERKVIERGKRLADKDQLLRESDDRIKELEHQIAQMQRSIAWQLLTRYHNCFVERALPQGTKSRGLYDLGLKGGRILINEGLGSFYRSAKEYRRARCISELHHSEPVNFLLPKENPNPHEDLFVCRQYVSTTFTPIEAQINLKKGNNLIRFHVPEGCERPCDIPELKTKDARCLSLGVRGMKILDRASKLSFNLVNNWHGAEKDNNEESFRWMTNDVTILVASSSDCQANLRFDALSFNCPRTIEIYIQTLIDDDKIIKNNSKKFILMKEVDHRANVDMIKDKLEEITEKLHKELR